jgi:hypothetical protein
MSLASAKPLKNVCTGMALDVLRRKRDNLVPMEAS